MQYFANRVIDPLIEAIRCSDLKTLEDLIRHPQWKAFEELPERFSDEEWNEPRNIFVEDDVLYSVSMKLRTATLTRPENSDGRWMDLYSLHVPYSDGLSSFEYRLFHLRGYFSYIYTKCFIHLANRRYRDWSIYVLLDNPYLQFDDKEVFGSSGIERIHKKKQLEAEFGFTNALCRSLYSKGMTKSWQHLAIESDIYTDLPHYRECAGFYRGLIQSDGTTRQISLSGSFPIEEIKAFAESAVDKFPQERPFRTLLDDVRRIEYVEKVGHDFVERLYSQDGLYELFHKNEKYWLYNREHPTGVPTSVHEVLKYLDDFKSKSLDWMFLPLDFDFETDGELFYIDRIRPNSKYVWPRVFYIALAFGSKGEVNPSHAVVNYFRSMPGSHDPGNIAKLQKEINRVFTKAAEMCANQNRADLFYKVADGIWKLNLETNFACIVTEGEKERIIHAIIR